jgi:hypothetical protein
VIQCCLPLFANLSCALWIPAQGRDDKKQGRDDKSFMDVSTSSGRINQDSDIFIDR